MPEAVLHGEADFVRRQTIRKAFKVGNDYPVGVKSFSQHLQEISDDDFFSCGGDDAEPDSDGYDSGKFTEVWIKHPKGFVLACDDGLDLQLDVCSEEVLPKKGQQRPAVLTLEERTDGVPLAPSGDSVGNLELRPFSVRQIEGAANMFEINGCGIVSLDPVEDEVSEEIATAIDQIGLSEMVSYVLENFDESLGEPSSDEEDYSLAINRVMEGFSFEQAADMEGNAPDLMEAFVLPDCFFTNMAGGEGVSQRLTRSKAGRKSVEEEKQVIPLKEGTDGKDDDELEDFKRPGDEKGGGKSGENGLRGEKMRAAREEALKNFPRKSYGDYVERSYGKTRLNIASINLAGAKQARDNPIDFAADTLSLMDYMDADILCFQDFNLQLNSYAFEVFKALLG